MNVRPRTVLCSIDDIADGKARDFAFGEGRERYAIILVRRGDSVHAYENACPHFQIPLDVGRGVHTFRGHLLCANHYAAFRFEDGYCVDGPCQGASLKAVSVEVDDRKISIVGTGS